MQLEGADKNYLLVPLKRSGALRYEFDVESLHQLIGKSSQAAKPGDLCFSQTDVRHLYHVDDAIPVAEVHQKPESKDDDSVLKKVLGHLTGRKNLIDAKASLHDYLYLYPNR